jgi:hypothetical protein
MSEKLVKFTITELATVRLTCLTCQNATEMTVDEAGRRVDDSRCPLCRAEWMWPSPADPPGKTPINQLAKMVQRIQAQTKHVRVEFVLPDPSK